MHTPTPWIYNPVDGEILANKHKLLLVGVSLPCGASPREGEAIENAKLIVQAVNAHAVLVEALNVAYHALAEAAQDYNHPSFTDRHNAGPRMKAAHIMVSRALAVAEGKGA